MAPVLAAWLASPMTLLLWRALSVLPAGAWIALATMVLAVVVGWAVALARIKRRLARLRGGRQEARGPKKAGKWKYLGLVLVALLPGGLIGTAAVAAILGKKDWRREAILIVGASLPPGLLLAWLSARTFPWPRLADQVFVTGGLGLIFAILHFWAMAKLLREAWGEPEDKVPWWPPLALWLKTGLLLAAVLALIGR